MNIATSPDRFVRRTLRPRREQLGITLAAVAKLAGYSATHVAVVENGGPASATAIRAVNAALGDLETAYAFYRPDVDATALVERVNEITNRLDQLETDRADNAALMLAAGRVLVNGHFDHPDQMSIDDVLA
jgi:transcriptional regulator with XRE-family HTH domain